MIQPNEVRIGNYFRVNGVFTRLLGVSAMHEASFRFLFDDKNFHVKRETDGDIIEPIQLTPDILSKCGFEERLINGIIPHWFILCAPQRYRKQFELFFRFGSYTSTPPNVCDEQGWSPYNDSGDRHSFDIKYLHQLQNLYFALTGEDLDVKL